MPVNHKWTCEDLGNLMFCIARYGGLEEEEETLPLGKVTKWEEVHSRMCSLSYRISKDALK